MMRSFYLFAVLSLLLSGACSEEKEAPAPAAPAQRTLLMYFPWSGDTQALTSYFERNIADMELVVAQGVLRNERVVVFFMPDSRHARLFELCCAGRECVRRTLVDYDPLPAFTTAAGIASILGDVKRLAPAGSYAMTIGCHGMAWLPASSQSALSAEAAPRAGREREYWEYDGPATRWFGGASERYRTDITTLAAGIDAADMHMEYILFDDCYMSSVEVAYALSGVADHLIGSTSEIMAYGFPYDLMGQYLVGDPIDYEAICDAFYRFYEGYAYPYGTIAVTVCGELEPLAGVMKRINARFTADPSINDELQSLDGYKPVRFFDMGDYVRHLCGDEELLAEFERRLARAVPPEWRRHTPEYYSSVGYGSSYPIRTFSGITTSDPSTSLSTEPKTQTSWWRATH